MSFIPAGEVLGGSHQVRTTVLANHPDLPDGEYKLIDFYCTETDCDCRKTIIQIFHAERHVSTVNFGWESPKYYIKWVRGDPSDEMATDMSGWSIDFMSPDLVPPDAILDLVESLMYDEWIARIKNNYREVRKAHKEQNNIIRFEPKISRNAPCPCGSGKKHKRCCLEN